MLFSSFANFIFQAQLCRISEIWFLKGCSSTFQPTIWTSSRMNAAARTIAGDGFSPWTMKTAWKHGVLGNRDSARGLTSALPVKPPWIVPLQRFPPQPTLDAVPSSADRPLCHVAHNLTFEPRSCLWRVKWKLRYKKSNNRRMLMERNFGG